MNKRTGKVQNITGESSAGKDLGTQSQLLKNRINNTDIIYNNANVIEKISYGLFSTNNYDTTNIGYDIFYPNTVDIEQTDILDFYIKIEREDKDNGELVPFINNNQTVKRKYILLSNAFDYLDKKIDNIQINAGGCDTVPFHKHDKLYDANLEFITLSTITENGNLIHNPSPFDIIQMNNDDKFYTGVKNSFVLGSKDYSIIQGTLNNDGITPNDKTSFASILSSKSTGIKDSSFAMILASGGEDLIAPPIIDTETGGDSAGIIGNVEIQGEKAYLSVKNIEDNDLIIIPVHKYVTLQLQLSNIYDEYPITGDSSKGEQYCIYLKDDLSELLNGIKKLDEISNITSNCEYKNLKLKTNNDGDFFRVETINNKKVTILFTSSNTNTFAKSELIDISLSDPSITSVYLPKIGTGSNEVPAGSSIILQGITWGGSTTLEIYGTDNQYINGSANYAMNSSTNNKVKFIANSDNTWSIDTAGITCSSYIQHSADTTPNLLNDSKYVISLASYHCKLIGTNYSIISGYQNIIYGNDTITNLPRTLFGKNSQLGSNTDTIFGIGYGVDNNFTNTTDDYNLLFSVGNDYIDFHNTNVLNLALTDSKSSHPTNYRAVYQDTDTKEYYTLT